MLGFETGQLDDKVQIVSRARNAPGVASHRSSQHVGHLAGIKTAHAVQEELLLGHRVRAKARRSRSICSTSAGVAVGC
jgi:ABC-type transport system involved in cytochrome c biogenesis ATPase subunit